MHVHEWPGNGKSGDILLLSMREDAREALLIGEVVGGLGSELAGSTYPQGRKASGKS
jgi:hypothetical protein